MNWTQVLNDPTLNNLPYKIETNERGQIVMSPVSKKHSFFQARIAELLKEYMRGGFALPEAPVQTSKGVRVPDICWTTEDHFHAEPDELFTRAPMICVEVWSPSNTAEFKIKTKLYLQAGALEVWTCNSEGKMRFFDATGELEDSGLAPDFPLEIN